MRRALGCFVLALATTACSGGDDTVVPRTSSSPLASEVSSVPSVKPTVQVPNGPPPTKLVTTDVIKGTGAAALPGTTVNVHYVGVFYDTGQQFDASWDRGHPFPFQLGNGDVIEGWDQGVVGMRVGGRRQLVIPPDLAYGADGRSGIPPNSTLIFVVDLISVAP